MGGVTAIFLASIIIGLPTIMIMLIANRFFKFREKKLEIEALKARLRVGRPVPKDPPQPEGSSEKTQEKPGE